MSARVKKDVISLTCVIQIVMNFKQIGHKEDKLNLT